MFFLILTMYGWAVFVYLFNLLRLLFFFEPSPALACLARGETLAKCREIECLTYCERQVQTKKAI